MFYLNLIALLWCTPAQIEWPPYVEIPAERAGLDHRVALHDQDAAGGVQVPRIAPLIDIDGDGHLDLMIFGHHNGRAATWLGNGDGTFRFTGEDPDGDGQRYNDRWQFGGRSPTWWDIDGDGHLDALASEHRTGWVFRNDGTGHFRDTGLRLPNYRGQILGTTWIDGTGDGRFQQLWQTGSGENAGFAEQVAPRLQTERLWSAQEVVGWPEWAPESGRTSTHWNAHWARWPTVYSVDLTGDNRSELILPFMVHYGTRGTEGIACWVLIHDAGTSTGWRDASAELGLPSGQGHWFYPEDLDRDGHLDLVDLGTGRWYRNDGRGRFVAAGAVWVQTQRPTPSLRGKPPFDGSNSIRWIDLTNNSHRDLILGGSRATGSNGGVFLNQGEGHFTEWVEHGLALHGRTGAASVFGDVNGNHKLDMALPDGAQPRVFLNQTPYRGLHVQLVPSSTAEADLGIKLWVYQAGRSGEFEALVHYRQNFLGGSLAGAHVLDGRWHVGLGDLEQVDIRVRFPSGIVRDVPGATAGTTVIVREQEPAALPEPR